MNVLSSVVGFIMGAGLLLLWHYKTSVPLLGIIAVLAGLLIWKW